jgi:CitMHS family citrate-Mg2+:H+ or citrate-Ca2+:H+ symporter
VTIVLLLALIMSGAVSPLAALVLVPTAAALVGGFGSHTAGFILTGVQQIAGVAGMFVFAILYFGVMTDAGLLDPIVTRILRTVGYRPRRIVVGSALLALLVHLDGSGAVTFLVTIPAMLPLYDRLGIDRRILACVASLAAGVNFLPGTGPMLRASAALRIPVPAIFRPLLPVQLVGLAFVFGVAYWLGAREDRRLRARFAEAPPSAAGRAIADAAVTRGAANTGVRQQPDNGSAPVADHAGRPLSDAAQQLRRPARFGINAALTLAMMIVMIAGSLDPVVVFMIGFVVALLINYPRLADQRARIDAHAPAALMMATILFAAGAFTGIMTGTGMLSAMAHAAVHAVPPGTGRHIPFVVGLLSMPLSLIFDPDSFYLGVLPIVAETARTLGVPPIQVGQAALLGQMTTGFPVSPLTPATFLLVGLSGIDLGAHQRYTAPWLLAASILMTFAAVLFGVFAL